ncbi:hypothetical protein [Thermoanaerobacterium sp. RBIITD]|uniref:hypothetical protein n=1 Tax=Thermoanaerobacterium sp. RBIITD TaxID=1550240 RepID=UPI000BB6FCB0|nr:hypothetical protein [Thermoanaerobacterium sp. RBIITD]SNX54983.1 hypothetical protein SAMN05660242_2748 [Thermoanaerobacterium sp. RBIITD]
MTKELAYAFNWNETHENSINNVNIAVDSCTGIIISENMDTWYYNWKVYDTHHDVNKVIE